MPFVFAGVVASIVTWPSTWLTRLSQHRIPLWLGKHSYSIYMVHWIAFTVVDTFARLVLHIPLLNGKFQMSASAGLLFVMFSMTLILFVASITYRYIEEPGRQLGRRILAQAR